MPRLVRLYITSVVIGFGLALVFVALLLWCDIAQLRHLVFGSDMGWLAGLMLVIFNGVVFAGVQFAISVMRMAEDPDSPKGGSPVHIVRVDPVQVTVPVTLPARR